MDKELYQIISSSTSAQAKYKERSHLHPDTKRINDMIVRDLDKVDAIAFADLKADKRSDALAEREKG